MMIKYGIRILRLLFGLALFSFGTYMSIQANIGLGAWEAFGIGIADATGLSYGDVIVLSGLVILVFDILLGERVGLGTVLNTLLIGKLVDLFVFLRPIAQLQSFFPGVLMMLAGQVVICLGIYFYVGTGLGAGPRDSLMVALGKRLPRVPIGVVRGVIEGTVLLIGWAMGAKVGVGTVIAVFGISFTMQATFAVLHFDVKAVRHEDLLQTGKTVLQRK